MALTDTALKAFKLREKIYAATDDGGLYVEVFPSGGIVWRYRYRLNSKYEKLTLKNSSKASQTGAGRFDGTWRCAPRGRQPLAAVLGNT